MVAQLDIRYHWILCYPLFYEDWKLHHCKNFNLITDRRWNTVLLPVIRLLNTRKICFPLQYFQLICILFSLQGLLVLLFYCVRNQEVSVIYHTLKIVKVIRLTGLSASGNDLFQMTQKWLSDAKFKMKQKWAGRINLIFFPDINELIRWENKGSVWTSLPFESREGEARPFLSCHVSVWSRVQILPCNFNQCTTWP